MAYLLDTNILSDLVRDPHGRVAARIRQVGELRVATSVIVAAELRYGAARRGSERLTRQVESILGALAVLPFDAPADSIYADIRAELDVAGASIGGNDLLIAAHARALDFIVVTANTREFGRVRGLACENWLADG